MSGPNGDPMVQLGEATGDEDYAALDFMLDQINFCLDHLEEKNDQLHAQLQDLLESNRQARRDFQMQILQDSTNRPTGEHSDM
ncbi:bublin coiled-coil protein-like [Xenopus laevis]|uniref:Bublin coiled-coil protein-like n=1 Tax=Xenopus laevis TaxID=8355 RepID=A0A8J0TG97_XENLA|nr:bublin coiled-coil protein-like [Xenopus laevis]